MYFSLYEFKPYFIQNEFILVVLYLKEETIMSETNNEMPNLSVGDVIQGSIVKVEDKQALVDLGYKTEGVIPICVLSIVEIETSSDVVSDVDELNIKM